MRRLLVALLALPLAGCVAAEPPPVVEFDWTREPATSGCGAAACAWEWWNMTLADADLRSLRVPVPEASASRYDPGQPPGAWWARNLTLSGAGEARLSTADGMAWVETSGTGDLAVRSHRLTVSAPGVFVERFVSARWGPDANETRPDALPVHLTGRVSALELTYEAHSTDGCRRQAAFRLVDEEGDARTWAHGKDEVTCE